MINKFDGEYRWLSNFWPVVVELDGVRYGSVEHAYQAAKSLDPIYRAKLAALPSDAAKMAKRIGHSAKLRPDWNAVRFVVMLDLLRQKFLDPDLSRKLQETGNRELVEGNWWHDVVWGKCTCKRKGHVNEGANRLGLMLMEIRKSLCGVTPQV